MASGTETGVNVKAIVVVLLALAGAGGLAAFLTRDAGVPQESAVVADEAEPPVVAEHSDDTAVEDDAATEPVEEAVAQTPPPPDPPRFDQIRVAPDGATVIAGRAPPGFALSLRLDGEEVATTRSSAGGEFAAILTLAPSAEPRLLSVLATDADGTEVPGAETAIIAPFGIATAQADAPDAPPEVDVAEAGAGADPAPAAEPQTLEVAAAETAPEPRPDTGDALPAEADAPVEGEDAAEDAPRSASDRSQDDATVARGDPDADTQAGAAAETTLPDPGSADAPIRDSAAVVEDDAAPDDAQATPPSVAPEAAEAPLPETTGDDASTAEARATDAAETPPAANAATEAPAIVVASPEGVRVVQGDGDAPAVQTEVRIDAITYTTQGDVSISGRGPADRQVRILLNNRPIQLGEIGPGGEWSLELPDVDPGTYTLTVAQLSPDGEVESRVDTPFLREDPARVSSSPMRVADGVSVITVQPGFTLWGIAEANFGAGIAYVQIFQENRASIRDPDLIFPGQIFRLPDLPRDLSRE